MCPGSNMSRPPKKLSEKFVHIDITLPPQVIGALDSYLRLMNNPVTRSEAIAQAIIEFITVEDKSEQSPAFPGTR